jgi:hypothetical protein
VGNGGWYSNLYRARDVNQHVSADTAHRTSDDLWSRNTDGTWGAGLRPGHVRPNEAPAAYARAMPARDQSGRERAGGRQLDERTNEAIEAALGLVETIDIDIDIDSNSDVGVDVVFASAGDGVFARKRLNEALAVRELLDEIEVWVWQADQHVSAPLTAAGEASGVELRLRRRS